MVLLVGEGGDVPFPGRHSGVQKDGVDATEAPDRFDHAHPVRRATHVGGDGDPTDRLGHATDLVGGDVHGHHGRAFGGEPVGAGQTDSRRRPRDDGDLPLQ